MNEKMKQTIEKMAIEFGFRADKYYSSSEKMFLESRKGFPSEGRY